MTRAALSGTLLLTIAVWAALLERIVSDPTNHVGVEPLLAVVPFLIVVSLSWLTKVPRHAGLRAGVTVYALLSIVAIVGVDRANVLVQYDRWAERGMPERPCAGMARSFWACKP